MVMNFPVDASGHFTHSLTHPFMYSLTISIIMLSYFGMDRHPYKIIYPFFSLEKVKNNFC